MTLREWAYDRRAEVLEERPRAEAVQELRAVADRQIDDAEAVRSADGRLEQAFAACLSLAHAALMLSGYRLRKGADAHHYLLIESLEYTVGLSRREVAVLQRTRQKRSRSMYERTGLVTATEAEAALAAARSLRQRFADWQARG
jgi:uncharacterized protein (UPF0332 family)